MDIGLLAHRASRLGPNLFAEVEESMYERRRDRSKGEAVRHGKCHGQEQRAICFVFLHVERSIFINNGSDIVFVAKPIIRCT